MNEISALGLVAIATFAATHVGVVWIRRLANRWSLLDYPNDRSSHTNPTPRGGGLAIVIVTLVAWNVFVRLYAPESAGSASVISVTSLAIAAVSWMDDLRSVSFRWRLLVHVLAAGVVVVAFLPYHKTAGFPGLLATLASGLAGLLWIVGLTNAYNFMDGIDGIAGGQGVIAGIGWALAGVLLSEGALVAAGSIIAASCGAFLIHNWSPARIFMGDVGSAFLGFFLASLGVWPSESHGSIALVGFLLVWAFVFDAFVAFLRRLITGQDVFQPHRTHIYQRLVDSGMSHQEVSGLYICLAFGGLVAALLQAGRSKPIFAVWALCLPAAGACLISVSSRRERESGKRRNN